eukprot:403357324
MLAYLLVLCEGKGRSGGGRSSSSRSSSSRSSYSTYYNYSYGFYSYSRTGTAGGWWWIIFVCIIAVLILMFFIMYSLSRCLKVNCQTVLCCMLCCKCNIREEDKKYQQPAITTNAEPQVHLDGTVQVQDVNGDGIVDQDEKNKQENITAMQNNNSQYGYQGSQGYPMPPQPVFQMQGPQGYPMPNPYDQQQPYNPQMQIQQQQIAGGYTSIQQQPDLSIYQPQPNYIQQGYPPVLGAPLIMSPTHVDPQHIQLQQNIPGGYNMQLQPQNMMMQPPPQGIVGGYPTTVIITDEVNTQVLQQ